MNRWLLNSSDISHTARTSSAGDGVSVSQLSTYGLQFQNGKAKVNSIVVDNNVEIQESLGICKIVATDVDNCLDCNSKRIVNVKDPLDDQDVATKKFVLDNGAVSSVAGKTGVVLLVEADIENLVSDLAGKASSSHTHPQSDITNLVSDLAGKASSSHTHPQSDITNLVSDLAGKASSSHTHTKSQITDFAHTHPQSDITNLVSDLAGKASSSHTHTKSQITDFAHTHPQSDITNLVSDLAGKALSSHTHTTSNITDYTSATNALIASGITGKLSLSGGTMTGSLNMNAQPITNVSSVNTGSLTTNTLVYTTSQKRLHLSATFGYYDGNMFANNTITVDGSSLVSFNFNTVTNATIDTIVFASEDMTNNYGLIVYLMNNSQYGRNIVITNAGNIRLPAVIGASLTVIPNSVYTFMYNATLLKWNPMFSNVQ